MSTTLNRIEAASPGADPCQQAAKLGALKPFEVGTRVRAAKFLGHPSRETLLTLSAV